MGNTQDTDILPVVGAGEPDDMLQKRDEIAYELEQFWGRAVTADSVTRFIKSTIDPLPAKTVRRRVIIRRGDLYKWAQRQVA
jgi:hypothetical protein